MASPFLSGKWFTMSGPDAVSFFAVHGECIRKSHTAVFLEHFWPSSLVLLCDMHPTSARAGGDLCGIGPAANELASARMVQLL
jgi:hypothetical protein